LEEALGSELGRMSALIVQLLRQNHFRDYRKEITGFDLMTYSHDQVGNGIL
jgi:hypothetical protein